MTAAPLPAQKEILHDSAFISWERVRSTYENAWIHQIKFLDRWLFLATDEAGRNYKNSAGEDDCYRIIEEAFPVTGLVGNRTSGAIEVTQAASKITL